MDDFYFGTADRRGGFPSLSKLLVDPGQQFKLCQNISAPGHSDLSDTGRDPEI